MTDERQDEQTSGLVEVPGVPPRDDRWVGVGSDGTRLSEDELFSDPFEAPRESAR